MPDQLTVRAATLDDAATITSLIEDAVAWLRRKGTDQWANFVDDAGHVTTSLADKLNASIENGECFVAVEGQRIAGSMVLDGVADPEFWPDADNVRALYVHRMVSAAWAKGRGVGSVLLAWAAEDARRRGYERLRLDAWSRNEGLHRYYEAQGFHQVAHHVLIHRGSGALFERLLKGREKPGGNP